MLLVFAFPATHSVFLTFVFNKSPVVFETSQNIRLSLLQVLASVLSAVMSLLGIFGILFALTLRCVLPLINATAGHVVDHLAEGGKIFIREGTLNTVNKYREEGDTRDREDSQQRIRVSTGTGTRDLRKGDLSFDAAKGTLWHLERAALPQLVPSSADEPVVVDTPAVARISPTNIAPDVQVGLIPASPSENVQWHIPYYSHQFNQNNSSRWLKYFIRLQLWPKVFS